MIELLFRGKKIDSNEWVDNHMKVIAINKKTKKEIVLEKGMTQKQAESFCEAWGWMFCDENGISYWLEIRDEIEN